MKTQFILLSTLLIGLSACQDAKTTETAPEQQSIVATDENTKELQESLKDVAAEEERLAAEAAANMTTMSFKELSHDFGTVMEDTKHLYNFVVTNTGKKPLFI
ncbi:MAG: hypothetical protein RLZZ357_1147, partial [Bacteroidota bacterium]